MIRCLLFIPLLCLCLLGCLRANTEFTTEPSTQQPTPVTSPTKNEKGELINPTGWSLPELPKNRTFKASTVSSENSEVHILSSYSSMKLQRFTEPYNALGSSGWGRLHSVTEYLSSSRKPYCYRLAAETDWSNENERVGALMVVSISDNDGDGIFETLSGKAGCPVPDWVK
jgi:hypothetical protein